MKQQTAEQTTTKQTCTNKEAWDILNEKLHIIDRINAINPETGKECGFCTITSESINAIAKRAARHVGNIYTSDKLPDIFKENGISILSIKNGTYCLGKFNAYFKIQHVNQKHKQLIFNEEVDTMTLDTMQTEDDALAYLSSSDELKKVINPNNEKLIISGGKRSTTNIFNFDIGDLNLEVNGAQFEVDEYYSFKNSFIILEAKVQTTQEIKDFLVRQLYYPYRYFKDLGINKKIIPILMIFSPKTEYKPALYTFYKYEFVDNQRYDSIRLVECEKYEIVSKEYFEKYNFLNAV